MKGAGMLCAVLSLFLTTACNDRRPAPMNGERYVISKDGGGQIISAQADRARLLFWGGRVEIRNYCASACVIFTTLPNACLGRNARIGFHSSTVNVGPIGNPQMARYLRGEVKAKFLAQWQYVPQDEMHWISARDYVRLDPLAKLCE
ncbi:MAG: hypothetical protein ACI91Z_001830 [Yoonia sp.]|jgi:hypothetical protein